MQKISIIGHFPNVATFGGVRSIQKQAKSRLAGIPPAWHKLAEFGSFSIANFGSFVDSQEMSNFGNFGQQEVRQEVNILRTCSLLLAICQLQKMPKLAISGSCQLW